MFWDARLQNLEICDHHLLGGVCIGRTIFVRLHANRPEASAQQFRRLVHHKRGVPDLQGLRLVFGESASSFRIRPVASFRDSTGPAVHFSRYL